MNNEELDFSKICRICCSNGNVMSIFKVHISRKLMACASIQVWRNDGLPEQICTRCMSKLHVAFQFKKLCEKSDARLRNHLKNLKQIQAEQAQAQQHHLQQQQQQQQQQQHQQQQHQQQHQQSTINQCNNYVYVECTPNNGDVVQEVRSYEELANTITATNQPIQPSAIPVAHQIEYNTLQSLSNGYTIQNLNVPATVHFQTYNVPIQMANQIITPLTHVNPVAIPVPIQQIATNQNQSISIKPINIKYLKSDPEPNKQNSMKSKSNLASADDSKKCTTCGKVFPNSIKLSRHMKIHSTFMPYRCHVCQKGFIHNGNLKVHLRMHNDERPYQCTMCDHSCRQMQDLEKHIRAHTGEKPYKCEICSKGFTTSSNLAAHLRIHTGDRPYVCSICHKGFCQSTELTKHIRTHTGEKSHICKVCNKGFNGSSVLTVHMRTHTGERPYVCSICGKGFSQTSCLQNHLKRHQSKGHKCTVCGKVFLNSSELNDHNQTKCPYRCETCDKVFSSLIELGNHMSKVHSIVNE